ncbi:hypothetical protein OEZ86_005400 [Tetradesmus obliquus]|nr:hypothetical protein OEZ86_005400 [Tetradesmus obliquus]
MPLAVDNVPFSEMGPLARSSTSHQGPRTAGNKSLLTFRSDVGIPGYTGYTPGWCTVPIPINGSTQHTGKLPDDGDMLDATAKADLRSTASEYRSTYKADLSNYHPPGRTGGGFWFEERQRKAAGNSPPFLSSTTYKSELLDGQATAQQQLQQSQGLNSNLVTYNVARDRRVQSASPCLREQTLSSTTACTSKGELIGYKTTYATTTALAAEKAAGAKAAAAARPMSCTGTERLRLAVMPNAGKPLFHASSTYSRDFGSQGSDPMLRATAEPTQQTLAASTRELNDGTTRSCRHLPRYTGFIPAAAVNEAAVQQAAGTSTRADAKAGMLPATLDQYSRSRLAHYTGYKPHAGAGATAVQPAHGPTAETTQGFANLQVLKYGPQPAHSRHAINSRKGLMTFFTGGIESVSDNGEADAQKFFAKLRPLEGRMKTEAASTTNPSGAKFTR